MNIMHASRDDRWMTPDPIIERVKELFGGQIDLDPASSVEANARIGAKRILTAADDALTCEWPKVGERGTSVFLNPPGGKIGNKSKSALFWQRLLDYRKTGALSHAVFAMFSVEGLQVTQSSTFPALYFTLCIPKTRVRWVDPLGANRTAPSHSSCFVYVDGIESKTDLFLDLFRSIGACRR